MEEMSTAQRATRATRQIMNTILDALDTEIARTTKLEELITEIVQSGELTNDWLQRAKTAIQE